MDSVMNQVDILLTLTTPHLPPLLEDIKRLETIDGYMEDYFTVFASLVGASALSLPLQQMGGKNMHYSIQLIAQHGSDDLLIHSAYTIKQSSV
jgi:Asp-tRNA(Asn)/Glu-tRNA(Gln) amidotransferase A subunit family amidase